MNYRDPELRDRLAGEYVLGTLRGRSRERFERLLLEDAALRDTVARWERHLNGLALAVPPRQPPARVWRDIERRIRARPEPRRRVWPWPLAAGVAAATAAVLALVIVFTPPRTRMLEPEFVATIGAADGDPRWSIAADADTRRLSIRTLAGAEVPASKDLELWLLPGGGQAPISLGLLPEEGRRERRIAEAALEAVPGAAGIAISREPAGGSPTGAPTGPVLYKGKLVPL